MAKFEYIGPLTQGIVLGQRFRRGEAIELPDDFTSPVWKREDEPNPDPVVLEDDEEGDDQ